MAEHLCLSCNFCCDGTLFDFVVVTEGEAKALPGGTPIEAVEGRLGMRQACVHLQRDRCCAIYAARPGKCAAFDCDLLKALDAGEVSRAEADARVADAKVLIAGARAKMVVALPDVDGLTLRRMMHALIDARDRVDCAAFEEAKLSFLRAGVFLEDHFHRENDN